MTVAHFSVSEEQWYWVNGRPTLRMDMALQLEDMGIPRDAYWLELPDPGHRYERKGGSAKLFFHDDRYAVLLKLSL